MTPQEHVRLVYPNAVFQRFHQPPNAPFFLIYDGAPPPEMERCIGNGKTLEDAWADAVRKLPRPRLKENA